MPVTQPYCEPEEMLATIGKIPMPAYLSPAGFVKDAAEEIDSMIGFKYHTPVDVAAGTGVARPVQLMLKRLNNHLASGRFLLAIASPEENANLHSYGSYLVRESLRTLNLIANGKIILEGAPMIEGDATEGIRGPIINNLDDESAVEAFQDRIVNPHYRPLWPGDGEPFPPRWFPHG